MEKTVYQHRRVWRKGLQLPEVLFLRYAPKYGPKRTHLKFLKSNSWNLEVISRRRHHIPELGKCIKYLIYIHSILIFCLRICFIYEFFSVYAFEVEQCEGVIGKKNSSHICYIILSTPKCITTVYQRFI